METQIMLQKHADTLEKFVETLKRQFKVAADHTTLMNKEILALRASNESYERAVRLLEIGRDDQRAQIACLKEELREAREER